MIKVDIRYPSDSLLMDDDTIGFYSWEAFRNHFERVIKWGVPMEVINISGKDERIHVNRAEAGLISCALPICWSHQDQPINLDWDLAKKQSDAGFIAGLNTRIRMAVK